jgi:outer membrane protein assembly factor BamB
VVVDGTVYVGSDGLYAVDASSGRQRWRFPAQTPVRSSPAVIDGTVYIASGVGIDDVYLHAIDAVTGQARWSRGGSRTGGGGLRAYLVPQSDPSVANGAVHIVEMDCGAEVAGACLVAFSLAAVDVVAGTERWRRFVYETQAPIGIPGGFTAPAVTTGFAYVGYSKGTDVLSQLPDGVQAFNAQTGAPRWFFPTEGGVGSSLTVADGVLYFGSDDNYVYAVDAVNGGERWRYRTQDAVRSSPAVIDGIVYVGSDDGVLYAIGGPGSSIDATATAGPASTVAPPGTTPIAPLTDGQIRPGITVEVNDDDVVLRDAPSLDSEIVATLRRGTELIVIGPSEEGDGHIWWPVAEPSTGRVGYVRETFLTVKD